MAATASVDAERILRTHGLLDPQASERRPLLPCLIVFAHADDEVLGFGAHLEKFRGARFVCATDGSPPDLTDAHRAGCATHAEYAALRRDELIAVVRASGHDPNRIDFLSFQDQSAAWHLPELTARLEQIVETEGPLFIVTQPYEGGHPDHDSVAFAVHLACRSIRSRGLAPPPILEMTAYHASSAGNIVLGEFIPNASCREYRAELSGAERERKRALFRLYTSQAYLFENLTIADERVRIAPDYDFTAPPHPGKLWYENFSWGCDGATWRAQARIARERLSEQIA